MASLFTTATTRSVTLSSTGRGESRGLEARRRREGHEGTPVAGLDAFHAEGSGRDAHADDIEELGGRLGEGTESVLELRTQVGHLGIAGGAGESLVEREALVDLGNIVF